MIDKYKYTDTEIKKILSTVTIIIDTREQKNEHITKWFDLKKIPYINKKLDFADYSFFIPKNEILNIPRDLYFDKEISVERKGSLNEIIGNFVDRDRIQDEFLRSKGKIHLIIENSSYGDMYDGRYQSKYSPKSAIGTLHAMADRYDLNFIFLDKEYTAKYIYCTFLYCLRNILK